MSFICKQDLHRHGEPVGVLEERAGVPSGEPPVDAIVVRVDRDEERPDPGPPGSTRRVLDERPADAATVFVVDDLDGQLGREGPFGRADPPDDSHRTSLAPGRIRLVLSRLEVGEDPDHPVAEPRRRSGVPQPA